MLFGKRDESVGYSILVNGIGFVGLLCMCCVFFVAVLVPLRRQEKEHVHRVDQIVALLDGSTCVAERHSIVQARLAKLEDDLNSVHQRVPKHAEDGAFLTALAKVAEEEQLQLLDYRRTRATSHSTHSHLELHFRCQGNYGSFCKFLHRVETMPRIARVSHLLLDASNSDGVYQFELRVILFHGLHVPGASNPEAGENS